MVKHKTGSLFTWHKGVKIYPRGRAKRDSHGHTTGATRPCQLGGCHGVRVAVVWPDGKLTRPCSKALKPYKDGLRII